MWRTWYIPLEMGSERKIYSVAEVNRKARMGRNPATGEPIHIPAKTVLRFRIAKAAKDAVGR